MNGRRWDNRHLGLKVRDLEKTLAYYVSLDLGAMAAGNSSFPGKVPGELSGMKPRIALSVGGSVQTEVIESAPNAVVPTDGLAKRDEGGHHLGIFVSDLAAEIERWADAGVKPLFIGASPYGSLKTAFMDTGGIGGVVFEFIQLAPGLRPHFRDAPPMGMKLTQLRHVGVIVKDMDRTIDFYNSLGLGPFAVQQVSVENLRVGGRSAVSPLKVKLAFSENCPLPIELIQPLSSGSVYQEFLEQQGEGIQHVACWVANLPEELTRLSSLGVKPIMGNERFVYLDTRDVGGLIIELLNKSPKK